MAKTNASRLSGRQSQVVPIKDVDEAENVKTDHQMDTAIEVKGNTSTVTVSLEKKNGEGDQMMDSADAGEVPIESAETEMREEQKCGGKGKRKAPSSVETSLPKKTRLLNDGYCLYVGNLNNSKTFDEIKDSLSNCFMTQSLQVQDIRLDRSKKYAFVDLASEMDLTKGLTLNGNMIHDKPMKIAKAIVKSKNVVQVKAPAKDKTAKDDRCLSLKNIPYNATKKDILEIFCQAVDVRFPGGTEGPTTGIAFVEFENKAIAQQVQQQKHGVEIQGRILIVDCVAKTNVAKVIKADDNKEVQSKTLIVMGLAEKTTAETLKSAFEGSFNARVPVDKKTGGVSKRFGFVDFESEDNCKAVKEAMKDCEIDGSKVTVAYAKAPLPPGGLPAGPGAARRKRKKAKKRAAGKPQDAVKEVENKV